MLRVCTAFTEDQRLVPSTHARQLTLGHLQLQIKRDLKPLISLGTCIHSQTVRKKYKLNNLEKNIYVMSHPIREVQWACEVSGKKLSILQGLY